MVASWILDQLLGTESPSLYCTQPSLEAVSGWQDTSGYVRIFQDISASVSVCQYGSVGELTSAVSRCQDMPRYISSKLSVRTCQYGGVLELTTAGSEFQDMSGYFRREMFETYYRHDNTGYISA